MANNNISCSVGSLLLSFLFFMTFISLNQSVCTTANGIWELGEECDGGLGCLVDCTCSPGFESTLTPSTECVAIACYNPVNPLSFSLDSSIDFTLVNSLVEFHAYAMHESTSEVGSQVDSTSVIFNSGSTCDYPANTLLAEDTLNTVTCFDDITGSNIPFATLSACLDLTCTDVLDNLVDCLDATTCTNTPCTKHWSGDVMIERTYTVYNDNNDAFTAVVAAHHPMDFIFPWVQSTDFDSAVWGTPNIIGSAVVTQMVYDHIDDEWTVVVSSGLNWPYMLTVQVDTINGIPYTVSGCATPPSAGLTCVQTLTFFVDGCTGINDQFGNVPASFDGLTYECYDQLSFDCPLAVGDVRPGSITITIDSTAVCDVVENEVVIVASDLDFTLNQPDYVESRGSFIAGDTLNFVVSIVDNIPEAAIASIDVVSFAENLEHSGISLATTTVVTPASPCADANTLCFSFDTALLTNLVVEEQTDLEFAVVIEIELSGIQKRMTMESSSFLLTLSTETEPYNNPAMTIQSSLVVFCLSLFSLFFALY